MHKQYNLRNQCVASTLTIVLNIAITTARQLVSSYAAQLSPSWGKRQSGSQGFTPPAWNGVSFTLHFVFQLYYLYLLTQIRGVPGVVDHDLSRVIQEEIRGHFADQEMAPPTSQEVGFLLKDAFGDRYHKTRSREGNIYVGRQLKRLPEDAGHDHA